MWSNYGCQEKNNTRFFNIALTFFKELNCYNFFWISIFASCPYMQGREQMASLSQDDIFISLWCLFCGFVRTMYDDFDLDICLQEGNFNLVFLVLGKLRLRWTLEFSPFLFFLISLSYKFLSMCCSFEHDTIQSHVRFFIYRFWLRAFFGLIWFSSIGVHSLIVGWLVIKELKIWNSLLNENWCAVCVLWFHFLLIVLSTHCSILPETPCSIYLCRFWC